MAAPFQPTFKYDFQSGRYSLLVILVPQSGTVPISYQTRPEDELTLAAISVTVDTTMAGGPVQLDCNLLDASGLLLASVRTGEGLAAGQPSAEATFAPNLPDSSTFTNPPPVTSVQTGLWEIAAGDSQTIQVSSPDPMVLFLEMRISVSVLGPMSGYVEIPPPTGYYQLA